MVASTEPTVVDFILVVEATANMVSHWDSIKKSYVRPAVEYFNGRQPSSMDYIGNHGNSQFGYVLFNAADTATEMSTVCSDITRSPWDFFHGLDNITFSGGGCEKCSHITEGLARALQLFDDLSEKRGQRKSKKICFLVCNSPPYELPCYDNYIYAGLMYEKLAELIGSKGINLSVISPQHIREIKQIYLAANQNKAPIMSYAQDQRHLVLISGFSLPTEQDPVKVEPEDKKTPVASNGSSTVTTSSMAHLSVHHSSPTSTFHQSNTPNLSAQSPASMQFSSNGQSISSASEVKSCVLDVKPAASVDLALSICGSNGPASITTQSNVGLGTGASLSKSSSLMMQNSPVNQRQASLSSAIPQSVQSSSSLQRVSAQNLPATTVTVKSEQLNISQRPTAGALLRAESNQFSVQSGNVSNSMQSNSTSLTMNSIQQIPNQTLFGSQSAMQNVATIMSADVSSSSIPKAPPYSTPNLIAGIQSSQSQQHNILNSVSSAGNIVSASSPASSLNQVPSRANSMQQGMGQKTSNIMMANSNIQISIPTPNVQINQPIGQRPQLSNQLNGSNVPVNSTMNINEQSRMPVATPYPAASNVANAIMDQAAQQQYNEAGLLWRGILEWKEKRKVSTGNPERTVHKVRCEVLFRQNQVDETLNASLWPNSLNMQLVPQVVFTYRDMKVQIENNINVMLRMSPIEATTQLINTMQTKWVGVVQIPSQNTQQSESRVMLIIYAQKNNQFFGVLPRDSVTFMSTIRQVIQHHHNVQRANSSALPMSGQPTSELQPFSSDNRINQQNVPSANQFVMPSSRPNVNTGMRPMGHIPNPSIAGRGNMQTGQQQRSLDLNYSQQPQQRMSMGPGNQPMVNSQMQQSNNMGQPVQQNNANQQIMYQNAMSQQRPIGSRMAMNQNNDIMRQQHDMMRQQQRIRQQQQSQQNSQMLRMQASHPGGQEQLRSLLQGSNMNQGMNAQHSNMHPGNQPMRQVQPSQMRPGYMPNQQQIHHTVQQNRMMGMQQQQRFGM